MERFWNMNLTNAKLSLYSFHRRILEADKLCGRLYQKLNSVLGQKIVMDHMPLLMVCLEVSNIMENN